jgi:hypothetical protein
MFLTEQPQFLWCNFEVFIASEPFEVPKSEREKNNSKMEHFSCLLKGRFGESIFFPDSQGYRFLVFEN